MDRNGNFSVPYFPGLASENFSFHYNYNYDQTPTLPPGMEMQQPSMMHTTAPPHTILLPMSSTTTSNNNTSSNSLYGSQVPKKKRLSTEQLESLENNFQKEIKLDPDTKIKLAKELGLQPRQIAVWYQNRRARWKGKQLERLYDLLKQEYDNVSRDNQKLQQEVVALRAMLKDQVPKNQGLTDYTEVSGEETAESTWIPNLDKSGGAAALQHHHQIAECSNYVYNVVDADFVKPGMVAAYNWTDLP